MAKRFSRKAIQFRAGAKSTFANRRLPRAQERVRRSDIKFYDPLSERSTFIYGRSGPMLRPRSSVGPSLVRVHYAARPRLVPKPFSNVLNVLRVVRMAKPKRVLFCVRRKIRREVLFAFKVASKRRSPGRGGSYRRTVESNFRC